MKSAQTVLVFNDYDGNCGVYDITNEENFTSVFKTLIDTLCNDGSVVDEEQVDIMLGNLEQNEVSLDEISNYLEKNHNFIIGDGSEGRTYIVTVDNKFRQTTI